MLILQDVYKSYGSLEVLDGVSLHISRGEIVALVGPSGCGKSTLLKILSGLTEVSRGRALLANKPIAQPDKHKVSLIFQEPVLLPWRNALRNITMPDEFGCEPPEAITVDSLLKVLGLKEFVTYYPSMLSGGMKQRVAIGRGLYQGAEVLLMDEPFSSIDEINRHNLNKLIVDLRNEYDVTIIFVTHNIHEAVAVSDRVLVLSNRPSKIKHEISINYAPPMTSMRLDSQEYFSVYRSLRKCLEIHA